MSPRHNPEQTPPAVRKTPKGTIVAKTGPVEHTAASKAALDHLKQAWGITQQAAIRRALEEAARAAGWPGLPTESVRDGRES